MTISELVDRLRQINNEHKGDEETIHKEADKALLEYINNKQVEAMFWACDKWYA